jgi:hypothetical protein
MSEVSDERNWTRVPIADLASPKGGGLHMVYRDSWWAIDAENRAFFFRKTSPQCNANRAIVERLKTHPDMTGVVQLPLAMWPVNISDYA